MNIQRSLICMLFPILEHLLTYLLCSFSKISTYFVISIVVLFIQAAIWKQAKCPRINKLWYVHTREYYSAIRLVNNKCHRQEKPCENSRTGRNYSDRKWAGGPQHLESGWELTAQGRVGSSG